MNRTIASTLAAGAALLSAILIIALLLLGCERTGCRDCGPLGTVGLEEASQEPGRSSIDEVQALTRFDWNRLICRWLPSLCDWSPCRDPFEPIYDRDPNLNDDRIKQAVELHTRLLKGWRHAPMEAAALARIRSDLVTNLGMEQPSLAEKELREILQGVLDGRVSQAAMPTLDELVCSFQAPGQPFQDAPELVQLLENLRDGVGPADVAAFTDFRQRMSAARPDLKLAAALMAASVDWWAKYERETGRNSSLGVAADISAIQTGGNPQMVAISSGVGLIMDLVFHFFSRD